MAKQRRKKVRTHVREDEAAAKNPNASKTPKSFVMRSGKVTASCAQLVQNLRKVMEPNTALRLKEQRRNRLKDFVNVAGQLGVTHFMMLSQTDAGTALRVARAPKGPSLTFHVDAYSLIRDVLATQQKPRSPGKEYQHAPLLVLNNFNQPQPHVKLAATVLQNMFPALNVQRMHVTDCRRVVMFDWDAETETIQFRHYYINVKTVGVSKSIKRIVSTPHVPNMHDFDDVGEFVLSGAHASESDVEDDTAGDNVVTLAQNYVGRNNTEQSQRAIRLTEIGPRMQLRLAKIQQGFCQGEIVYQQAAAKEAAPSA